MVIGHNPENTNFIGKTKNCFEQTILFIQLEHFYCKQLDDPKPQRYL